MLAMNTCDFDTWSLTHRCEVDRREFHMDKYTGKRHRRSDLTIRLMNWVRDLKIHLQGGTLAQILNH